MRLAKTISHPFAPARTLLQLPIVSLQFLGVYKMNQMTAHQLATKFSQTEELVTMD